MLYVTGETCASTWNASKFCAKCTPPFAHSRYTARQPMRGASGWTMRGTS